MTTEPPPPSSGPGPDQKIEDIATDIEHTRQELGAPTKASSARPDVTGRAKQKVAEAQDRITETTSPTTDVVENARNAQATARDSSGVRAAPIKPTVIAALIATATDVVVVA